MIKVCYISEDALLPMAQGQLRGGAIFLYYASKFSDCFVINPYFKNRPKFDRVNGATIYRIFGFSNSFLGKIVNSFILFTKGFFIIRKEKPDLILATTTTCYFPAYLIAKVLKLKCKIHVASSVQESRLKLFLMKLRYDEIITISPHLKDQIVPVARAPIRIVPNGIDFDIFVPKQNCRERLGVSKEVFLILYVGAFEKVKRLEFIIDLFNIFQKRHPQSKLLLVGKGREEKKLKIIAKKLNLSEKIDFKGLVSHNELASYYSAGDVLLLCSKSEGGSPPRVVLEAMACNMPAISIRQGDDKELEGLGVLLAKTKEEYLAKLEQVFSGDYPTNLRDKISGFSIEKEISSVIQL